MKVSEFLQAPAVPERRAVNSLWLRRELEKRGIPLSRVAEVIGRHPGAVSRILSGKRGLRAPELWAISRLLDLPPSEVLSHLYPGTETPGHIRDEAEVRTRKEVGEGGRIREGRRVHIVARPRGLGEQCEVAVVTAGPHRGAALYWLPGIELLPEEAARFVPHVLRLYSGEEIVGLRTDREWVTIDDGLRAIKEPIQVATPVAWIRFREPSAA